MFFMIAFQERDHPSTCPLNCRICKEVFEKGLTFLVKRQSDDGSWREISSFRSGIAINYSFPITTTALVSLSLIAGGTTLEKGRFRNSLKKGLNYILKRCTKDGRIFDFRMAINTRPILETAVAVIFLSEICQLTTSPKIKSKIKRALKYLSRIQLRGVRGRRGGWDGGYAHNTTHIGKTYTILGAFLSARSAGIKIPSRVLPRAIECLRLNTAKDGSLPYETFGIALSKKRAKSFVLDKLPLDQTYPRVAAVLYILHKSGKGNLPEAIRMKRFLKKHQQEFFKQLGSKEFMKDEIHFRWALLFACFYQYFYGNEWKKWYVRIRKTLLKLRSKKGGWRAKTKDHLFHTALNLLILQLPLENLKTLN
jgi:hypothetical protein